MNRNEVFKILIEILEKERVVKKEALKSATEKVNIIAELGIPSAEIVNLMTKIEDRFGVEFEDDDIDNLDYTIGSSIDLILKRKENS